MGKQVVKLETILAKLQATFGTMSTPLTSADYVQGSGAEIQMENEATDIETIGGSFGQDKPVIGAREGTFTYTFPLRTGGVSDVPGDWSKFLQACGFKEASTSEGHTYSKALASSEWKDLTIWGYGGAQGSNASIRSILSNALFGAKITLDFASGYAKIDFTGKGEYDGLPAPSTQPTITRKSLSTASLIGFAGNVLTGLGITPISVTIDIANEITVCLDPQAANGGGKSGAYFTDMKIKYEIKGYVDTTLTKQPHAAIQEGMVTIFEVGFGTVPNEIRLYDANVVLKSVKSSDTNGIKTYDISAVSVDNGFEVVSVTKTGA
jgi:hypothetical protein